MSTKQTRSLRQKKNKQTLTVTDPEEIQTFDNHSEDTPPGVHTQQDSIDGQYIQFVGAQTTSGTAPDFGDTKETPELSS